MELSDLELQLENSCSSLFEYLRGGYGFDLGKFSDLKAVVRACASELKGSDQIPKSIALALLDIYPIIEMESHGYNTNDARKMQAEGIDLLELIRAVLGD